MDIVPATRDDGAAVRGLLTACGLPIDDLAQASFAHFLVWREAGELLGTVGIDSAADIGLLRSLAGDPRRRASGAGTALLAAAETLACRQKLSALYLLTNGAEASSRRAATVAGRTQRRPRRCPSSLVFVPPPPPS